jgi:hypothetical protein
VILKSTQDWAEHKRAQHERGVMEQRTKVDAAMKDFCDRGWIVHTGGKTADKPFVCKHPCDSKFRDAHNLNAHFITHLRKTKDGLNSDLYKLHVWRHARVSTVMRYWRERTSSQCTSSAIASTRTRSNRRDLAHRPVDATASRPPLQRGPHRHRCPRPGVRFVVQRSVTMPTQSTSSVPTGEGSSGSNSTGRIGQARERKRRGGDDQESGHRGGGSIDESGNEARSAKRIRMGSTTRLIRRRRRRRRWRKSNRRSGRRRVASRRRRTAICRPNSSKRHPSLRQAGR